MTELKPLEDITKSDITAMRAQALKDYSDAMKWKPWLGGKVTKRVENLVRRAYQQGNLAKPINELADEELLTIFGIGSKTLAAIRKAIAGQN